MTRGGDHLDLTRAPTLKSAARGKDVRRAVFFGLCCGYLFVDPGGKQCVVGPDLDTGGARHATDLVNRREVG